MMLHLCPVAGNIKRQFVCSGCRALITPGPDSDHWTDNPNLWILRRGRCSVSSAANYTPNSIIEHTDDSLHGQQSQTA